MESFGVFGRLVGRWWRERVNYTAQVQYFTKRSLAGAVKVMIGLGTGLVAVISLAILFPAADPQLPTSRAVVVTTFAAVTLCWAVVWCCRPWPSRRLSAAFIITSDIGIA